MDEQQALAQLEKVLAAEREIKREQVTLLVCIKNILTPDQQAKLSVLFFFSSRRRHTRCYRDWSSDVALPISRELENQFQNKIIKIKLFLNLFRLFHTSLM